MSAAELPSPLISSVHPYFPPCHVYRNPLIPEIVWFTVLRASSMHPNVNRIALVCPYTCACNAVLRAPPFKAPSKAHFLIPFKGLIPLIFINSVVPGVDLITSSGWPNYFGCQYSTLSLLLPPSGANTPVPDLPSLFTAPAPVRPFSLPSFSVHAPTCLHCQTQKMPRRL